MVKFKEFEDLFFTSLVIDKSVDKGFGFRSTLVSKMAFLATLKTMTFVGCFMCGVLLFTTVFVVIYGFLSFLIEIITFEVAILLIPIVLGGCFLSGEFSKVILFSRLSFRRGYGW